MDQINVFDLEAFLKYILVKISILIYDQSRENLEMTNNQNPRNLIILVGSLIRMCCDFSAVLDINIDCFTETTTPRFFYKMFAIKTS